MKESILVINKVNLLFSFCFFCAHFMYSSVFKTYPEPISLNLNFLGGRWSCTFSRTNEQPNFIMRSAMTVKSGC